MTKINSLEVIPGNVFQFSNFLINFKQRSFEDFIGTSFGLIEADLLLIWMNE